MIDNCISPCYVGLKNNVSTRLLETTLNKFPENTEDFVSHSVLKNYIQDTALKTGVHSITQYDTDVSKISKSNDKWDVTTKTLQVDSTGSISRHSNTSVSSKTTVPRFFG